MTKHDFELYIISTVSFSVKLSQAENHCQYGDVVSCGYLFVCIFRLKQKALQ